MTSLVLKRTVDIKGHGLGPYNRILGLIYMDGKNINLEMLKQGLAEVFRSKLPGRFNARPYRDARLYLKGLVRIAREAKKYLPVVAAEIPVILLKVFKDVLSGQ